MSIEINVDLVDDAFHFRGTDAHGITVEMDDASARPAGEARGASPMQLLLMGLGGCSGIDIVSILRKGRQPLDGLSMRIEADRADGPPPRLFTRIHVHFAFTGALDVDRVRRAIDLSLDTYCSVARTLDKTAAITYDFSIDGVAFAGTGEAAA